MKILFLGSVIKQEDCTKHLGPSVAGNRMQLGLVRGLEEIYRHDLSIITQYPIAAYPREKKIFIKGEQFNLTEGIHAIKVPFVNILFLKQLTKIVNTFFKILKWGRKNKDKKKVIICYNAFSDTALPVLWASKMLGAESICLLADLPISDVFEEKKWKEKIREVDYFFTRKNIMKFSGLAVLNENAINEYAPLAKYVVIDGGLDIADVILRTKDDWRLVDTNNKPLRVIYSGKLIDYNGILELLEATRFVKNERFLLEVYGNGPLEEYITKVSKENRKIIYKGLVSANEILNVQREATLLVSPLNPEHPVAKVAFPSKIVEYMASGTPVVTTRVSGLGKDYLDNVFVFENQEPVDMAKKIDYILSLDKENLMGKGLKAQYFVYKHKNWRVQSSKIADLIKQLG